ncbi:putative immunoglobulin-blocking virulence protein [Mycoplasma sp. OR1901]|uniref:putative immunoglobulin-blocking virulence protein n=1 Tax=Mycoplasma sp. OR1901 TaxID=2742195 RepID=UPI0015843A2D|nr:putative immunoglobulin-blocking virulence protein [Mycoplasma sp. OR1901]QKT05238.1 putative immunoglobulin-blocking virulence protein [Mycoplasma sp. OR1901]
MKLFKNRKNRLLIITLISSVTLSSSMATFFYSLSSKNSDDVFKFKFSNPKIVNNSDLDFKESIGTIVDNNLKPLPKPEPIVEKKVTKNLVIIETPKIKEKPKTIKKVVSEIVKEEPKKEEIKKEEIVTPPKVEPKKVVEVTKVEQPQPTPNETPDSRSNDEGTGAFNFKNYKNLHVTVDFPKEREYSEEDINKGLVNPDRYAAEILPNVRAVKVTDKLRETTALNAREGLRDYAQKAWLGWILDKEMTDTDKISRLRNNGDFWFNYYFKYLRLLRNGDKVKEFLTDEGKEKYEELKKIPGVYKHSHGDVKFSDLAIINYIDFNKFTKASEFAISFLAKGAFIVPGEDGILLNENGELESDGYTPIYNGVIAELTRNNSERRVFGNKTYYGRSPESIANGEYDGWYKFDQTDKYDSKYNLGISSNDGIRIDELVRAETDNTGKINEGVAVEIDASNNSGYQKALKLIKDLKENKVSITAYRFKNIGKNDSSQKFRDIFKELPEELPLLELFLESYNTSALSELRHKKIKELGFYTTGDSLSEEWNFNPWALKNVSYVNTADYNVSFDFGKDVKVISRLTFNTLSFDPEDVSTKADGSNDVSKINDGLRMAYWVRNNEKIFQGSMGPGLNPDHNEGNNGYQMGLDFSRTPNIKSLKGLIFHDIRNPKNKPRKLNKIVFFNNKGYFDIATDELNDAQFDTVLDKSNFAPRSKIVFSNKKQTNKIRIIPKRGIHKLTSSGFANLSTLIEFSDGNFSRENLVIEVPTYATELYNQLSGSYTVNYVNEGESELVFT